VWGGELNSSVSGQRKTAGSFEHGNESSGSMKCGVFLDQLSESRYLKGL